MLIENTIWPKSRKQKVRMILKMMSSTGNDQNGPVTGKVLVEAQMDNGE